MSYERTVAAALAETTSKFRLAEALALDIPPRHRGPSGDEPVDVYLAQAQAAIMAEGGEYRSVETLREYRVTALWVSGGDPTNFRWAQGVSYTAHNEARKSGLTYEQFTAAPSKTLRDFRRTSPERPENVVSGWTPEQRAQAAQQIMSDPDVAGQVISDPAASASISQAQIRQSQQRIEAGASQRRQSDPAGVQGVNRRLSERAAQLALGKACDDFTAAVSGNLPSAGQLADSERFWLAGARDRAGVALAALSSYLDGSETDLDADLVKLLGESGG